MSEQNDRLIWERVTAKNNLTAEQALLPEYLIALITKEKNCAAAYHQLAARLSGAESNTMRRLKAQAENRVRQLNTHYFLLTGMRAGVKPETVPFHSELCDALREQCLSMLALQTQYEKTLCDFPTHTDALKPLSAELRQNLRTVTGTLQKRLSY